MADTSKSSSAEQQAAEIHIAALAEEEYAGIFNAQAGQIMGNPDSDD